MSYFLALLIVLFVAGLIAVVVGTWATWYTHRYPNAKVQIWMSWPPIRIKKEP